MPIHGEEKVIGIQQTGMEENITTKYGIWAWTDIRAMCTEGFIESGRS